MKLFLPLVLPRAAFRGLRTSIIDLVLATDMAKHFEHLTKFNMNLVRLSASLVPRPKRVLSKDLHVHALRRSFQITSKFPIVEILHTDHKEQNN